MTAPILPKSERDDLVIKHRPFAAKFAHKTARRLGSHVDLDDLLAEAFAGLVEAAERFDPSRGLAFTTYAAYWMKHEVYSFVERTKFSVAPPRDGAAQVVRAKLWRVVQALKQETGGDPTDEQIAERMGAEVPVVRRARMVYRLRDVQVSTSDDAEDGCYTPRVESDQHEALEREQIRHHIALAVQRSLARLPAKARDIIRRHYCGEEPETLREIGESYGLSRERVRQIEAEAMPKFRRALERELRDVDWRAA